MIVAIILFLVIVLGAPFLIEHLFKTSTLFKAEDAYDVEYDGKYLTFKTDTKKGEINWKFKGDCTVWYWACPPYKGRCSIFTETELHKIWSLSRKLPKKK